MLSLEKMEIHGFKSFCHRTELAFDPGVTAVVGPNGCGKSNILDALTWVLGEQSAKSLRSGKMQDVIFAGSQRLKPLGLAEVTVNFKSDDGSLPQGKGQVSVTRRLHRSGESDYALNGVSCRLRDIQDLLYGTGMGVKAYSVIEQGRIGTILGAKPNERRALIEEAAGITKFRSRRREAELKLSAAQTNLVRVADIIREVSARMGTLKRQASKARRYRRLHDELLGTLAVLYAKEYRELLTRQAELLERLADETDLRLQLETAAAAAEAELEELKLRLERDEASLVAKRQHLHELGLETDRTRQSLVYDRERVRECGERAEGLLAERREAELALDELEATRAGRVEEIVVGREQLSLSEQAVKQAAEARSAVVSEIDRIEKGLEELREELLRVVGRTAELRNALEGRSRLVEQHRSRLERLGSERSRIELAAREAVERQAGLQRSLSEASTRQQGFADAVDRHRRDSQAARAEQQETERALEAARGRTAQLAERLKALDEILARGRDVGTASERVLNHLAESEGFVGRGVLADQVCPEARYEAAAEAALGSSLGAILVDTPERAIDCVRLLEREQAGKASFLVLDCTQNDGSPLLPALPVGDGVVGWLVDLVGAASAVAGVVTRLAGSTVIVDSLETAFDLIARGGTSYRMVTLAGELVEAGALARGGRSTGDGLLSLRRERRGLEQAVTEAQADQQRLESLLQGARQRAEEAEQATRLAQERQHAGEKELLGLEHEAGAAGQETAKLESSLKGVAIEVETLASDLEVLEAEQSEDEQRLNESAARQADLDGRLGQQRAELEQRREEATLRGEQLAEAESLRVRKEEALKTLTSELERIQSGLEKLRVELGRIEQATEENRSRKAELVAAIDSAEQRLEQLSNEYQDMEESIRLDESAVAACRHDLLEKGNALKQLRLDAAQQLEVVQAVEIDKTRLEGEIQHFEERCYEELGRAPAEVAELFEQAESPSATQDEEEGAVTPEQSAQSAQDEPESAEEEDDQVREDDDQIEARTSEARLLHAERSLEDLKQHAAELRQKLDRLGPVNVLAIEEYEELEERHTFLAGQTEDLNASIASLHLTISRINRTSRERFRSAFEAVNQYFSGIFTLMFGGGRAELRLTEAEDVLEAGLELVAQPPGKRLQNIMLMSGGEKALAALALLFALFRYKPSPFCVLDEVDAPLDDANIERFLGLLKELNQDTQFILITHSPITMRSADVLYGVTMEEPGVSRLVSARFKDQSAA